MNIDNGFIKIPRNVKSKFVLFGTGEVADGLIKEIEDLYDENKIIYFIDSNRTEKVFRGKPVLKLSDIVEKNINDYIFIIASYTKSIVMQRLLIEVGVNENNIIAAKNYFDYKKLQYEEREINDILVYPPITSNKNLEDILEDINWFLLKNYQKNVNIRIVVTNNVEIKADYEVDNVIISKDISIDKISADLVLAFDYQVLKEFNDEVEIYCLDKTVVEMIDIKMLLALSYRLLKDEIKSKYKKMTKQNFTEMKKIGETKMGAAAIGTGPSLEIGLDKLEKVGMDKFLKIVCNRTATSEEIINRINPELYTFMSTFTIEKQNYSSLKIVIDYILNHECVLVIPDYFLGIILSFGCIEKVILVNIESEKVCFPSEDNITVCREMCGIMTGLVLPFASAFCKNVYILGCDGKKMSSQDKGIIKAFDEHPKFDYNWSGTLAYEDANSIFRLMEQHKSVIEYGEEQGNVYKSITHSYNEYLEERYVESI